MIILMKFVETNRRIKNIIDEFCRSLKTQQE